eukprot:XP_001699961.1 dynein heavy chain 4 [Chlamydomonas reinhardtii]
MHAPCAGQDAEAITAAVDEYYRSAYKMAKAARDDRVVAKVCLKEDIEGFRKYSQLFMDACNPALQAHHWAQILQGLLGRPADDPAPGDPVSVAHLIEWGAMEQAEALSNISGAASKELSLRRALSRMKEDWVGVDFKMVPYKDTGSHVVGHTDEIQMQLDEQLMKIQAMNASPFVKPFRGEAEAWQAALEGLQELLDSWLACQSVWMYLEPIFSSPDIVKQMPAEGAKFAQARVDMTFRMLVDEVVANPGAIALAKEVDRRTSLAEANRLLDEVQRGLSRYLEAKRLAFPRFFFLSNDEMLEILSETKDPTRVQPHLRKCFEGIHRLQFEPNTNGVVSAMLSLEGEKVPFMQHINTAAARGKVEQWLLEAVHAVTGRGIEDYAAASAPSGGGKGGAKPKRHEWALRWPGMVVLLAAGVFWTRGVEDALAAQKLPVYEKQCSAELREIVDLVRGELTGLQRATLGALVVMDVHARDVVAALAADKVEAAADFGWQAQLRTYWQATDVSGSGHGGSLEYGYEYLGNSSRLVITPLTDRCYRTLMGAIHLNLGGAPEGPAGTGKTETTKDLAKALARQCVVFNCSDTLNYQDMAKFFKGLAAAGAWACFDEFNRINLEVLSVVAQQVLDIQRAIAARLTMFTFEGSELPLKWSAWCAITMNPGYAGRSELPDNLKALFRSVAMMVPDYAMIAEIILYSYGYLAARPAAKKIVACYKLCSEQLSSQDHYDYGMRAVMAVLRAAGNLKRRFANAAPSTANQTPEQQETEELGLVLRSIVDVNLCKFLSHDVPLFNGIVSDLFPGITLPKPDYGPLAAALKTACANSNLQPTEYFITKATQLYEMVLVRHGLMLVGMPFSGKTAAYTVRACGGGRQQPARQAGERASFFVLNPKSVTMGQLYGQNDPASHEWTDGVLAVLFRRCAADPSPDRKWLVLDGPVDAIWIENMNTVLDDNKKLCLNSGEIIAMSAPMNLIFEVGDLAVASPATVSRCGMVYLEPQQLGTGPLLLPTTRHVSGRALVDQFVRRAVAGTLSGLEAPSGGSAHVQPACLNVTRLDSCCSGLLACFNSILVPTVDTAAVTFLLSTAINAKYPFLLVGPTGTGKSVTVVRCLLELDPEVFAPANIIGFSAQTSANATQALVDAKVDKRRKGVYGPAGGRRGVVFIDDLNMPQRETYGAQPPIELLRQLLDHNGWYSRDNAFRAIQDVLMVGAMGPPGGGRAAVTPRFSRHFATLCLTEASTPTLKHIFGTIQNWFLTTRAFPDPVMELREPVIAATLDVYSAAMTQLLPTPTKSHYTFNLRDCSRVVQGLQVRAATMRAQQEAHVRLWVHEVLRVFYDRLVDVSEQQWLLDLLRDLAHCHFGMRLDALLSHLTSGAEGSITPGIIRRCLFADYMTESDENGYRPYLEVARPSAAVSRLEDLLADYNGLAGPGKRQLHLAMFLYAVEHVTRIARVLRQEGGHALCVGVGGSGRQSLARLAAFICGMEAFQVEISRSYGLNEWRDDLRRLARRAGAEAKPTVFIFGDSQAAQEAFVEDVNSLLNSGEVPNLFPHDERSAICEAVRAAFKRAQPAVADPSPATLWSFFVGRCRANLHVVLAFSPAGDAFRERLRRFPSIVNCCTIDWFHAWPDDALDAVAAKLLAEVDLQGPGQRGAVKDLCKTFHAQVTSMSGAFRREAGRHNYVTPTSYLELISCFATLLAQRRAKVLAQQQKYENGLDKLAFTAEQVAVMRAELQALAPVLARTVAETEQLLKEIAREKEEVVEPKRAMVDVEVKQADHAAAAARAIKEECEMILSEALPALEAATQALDTIKSADIKLVQTFKSPPAAVKIVMEAVCVCLDVKPTLVPDPNMAGKKIVDWWDASKRLLMDTTLIQRLKDYDRDNIPQRIIDKIRKEYTGDPDFTPANAAKASSAAEGLCKWVHAMDQYDKVAKVVAPKRAALAEAEAEYANVLMGLHGKQAELKELLEKLAGLEAKLAESQARKAELEAETELCALKLERAEQLMSGLGGERERWTAEAARLRGSFGAITGDMLLAAGAVAYLGAFTMPYRCAYLQQGLATGHVVMAVACSRDAAFSLTAVLGDPVKIREWVIFGLPNDSFSIDSAVIAATSRRWPLCIDPQGQANRWIKAMHEAQKIKVLKLSDPDYLRTVEAAVSFGLPVLLENVGEELDPSLEPLLLKQTYRQGAQLVIKLGDNVVEYSPDFRMHLTTALRNPHYLPETAVKVALLNFSITPEGLADQLLGVAVAAEMPQLEEQRQALVVSSAENAKQLVEIEARILQVLSSTEGNILEDATAVQVLSEAKRLSDDISAKQAVAEKTQAALDAARTRYRAVAEMSAAVFFAIADLASVDYMYQYSLSWFIGEQLCIPTSAGAALAARLRQIESHFLYAAYCNVSRSLFEKDKLLLSFLLASRLAAHRGNLPHEQLRFLVNGGGGAAPAGSAAGAPPAPLGIPVRAWSELLVLSALPGSSFSSIPAHISRSADEWAELVESPDPHARPFPAPLDSMLSSFGKLLVLRCLRPDKLVPALEAWVAGELGQAFVSPPPMDLAAAFAEASGPSTPLLFVLSPGTDPWAALLRFAEERGQAKTLQVISLGQGQGPKAAALIEAARGLGGWVLLQNCHLAPSWMPTLERLWEAIREDNTDAKFRLWMTCMPTPDFPATLLQASVKMTSEPPQGLRANMRRSMALEPLSEASFWELPPPPAPAAAPSSPSREGAGADGPPTLKRLLFGLVFLHAAVQERRRYGPIGWNVPYGFDDGDLRISARQMRMYVQDCLQRSNPVPYEALRYAIGECNYGGRVTDDKDRLLLATMLRRIVAPELALKLARLMSVARRAFRSLSARARSYMSYVETLPTAALPDVFGLHLNADISKDLATTNGLLASLTATSGGAAAGGGDAGAAALVQGLLDRVPADFNLEAVQAAYPVSYHQSLNQVLVQELARYNRLLSTLRTSLTQLGRAVAGLALLSAELEGVLQAVEAGQVPAAWKPQSFPSLKPLGGYMTDLVERCAFLSGWAQRGPPAAFWLGAFFFPPAFTTAALQNFARGHQLPIDAVGFDFEMLRAPSSLTNPPPSGVYVYGLYLEGAGWDRAGGCLAEPEPKQLYCPAPAIWFKTVRTADSKPTPAYACPVYRTADRRGVLATTGHSTNFLMTVRLPLDRRSDHWVLRGVAMLTSLPQ